MNLNYDKLARDVLEAHNKARTRPTSFVPILTEHLKLFKGNTLYKPGEIPLVTKEGPAAIEELIQFLKSQQPIEALTWNDDMTKASEDHANDIGVKGLMSHDGSDGSTMTSRIERYGEWMGKIGENIDFGGTTGDEIVMNLMIDDGNRGRGHRKNIFENNFKVVGVGCSKHRQFEHCCVIDYATEFTKKGKSPVHNLMVLNSDDAHLPLESPGFGTKGNRQFFEGIGPNANIIGGPLNHNDTAFFDTKKTDSHHKETGNAPKKDKEKAKSKGGCFCFFGGNKDKEKEKEKEKDKGKEKSKAKHQVPEIPMNNLKQHNQNTLQVPGLEVPIENRVTFGKGEESNRINLSSEIKNDMNDDEPEAPPGTVKISKTKSIERRGDLSVEKVTITYTMADGSTKVVEKMSSNFTAWQ